MANKIPRVLFEISDEDKLSGVKTMSLVDEPAIQSDFVFFRKQRSQFVELKNDKYKQVVFGPALIPDKDILRFDAHGNPYNGYFSVDGVVTIRNKFHKEQLTDKVNTDHNPENYIDAFLIESFIIDSAERLADVISKGVTGATLGTWMVAYKIENTETFKRVISGELRGFSVEIFLNKFNQTENKFNKQANIMNELIEKFKTMLAEFENKETKEATKKLEQAKSGDQTIEYGQVGDPVSVIGADGASSPAPDGDYTLDNGKVITVASGVATEVKDAPVQEEQKKKKVEPKKEEQTEVESKDNFKAELDSMKVELAKAKEDLVKASEEITKLKKAPLTTPITKTELKKSNKLSDVEFNKLSNIEKVAYKNGVTLSQSLIKKLNNN